MPFILIASVLLFSACGSGTGQIQTNSHPEATRSTAGVPLSGRPPKDTKFEKADGLVVYGAKPEALEAAGGRVVIYDEEGKPFKSIDPSDESLESLEGESGDFFPFDFSNGARRDFLIEMRLTGRSDEWLEVIAHESRTPPVKAYVRVGDPLFKVVGWEEWVLGHFNIRFDKEKNPVLEKPDGTTKAVSIPDEPLIRPAEVKGDWVLIRWTKHEPDEPSVEWLAGNLPENSGWIRWRKGDEILIREYYP